MSGKLVVFPHSRDGGTIGTPAGWTIVEGNPQARTWRTYASEDGAAFSGVWECTTGAFRVAYDKWEFCHVLSGSCVVTPDGEEPTALKAGDSFVLEAGFSGRWEVTEDMQKHFVFRVV